MSEILNFEIENLNSPKEHLIKYLCLFSSFSLTHFFQHLFDVIFLKIHLRFRKNLYLIQLLGNRIFFEILQSVLVIHST